MRRLFFPLLPALLIPAPLLLWQAVIADSLGIGPGFWEALLACLAVAAVLLGLLFSQWRVGAVCLLLLSYYLAAFHLDARAEALLPLAALMTTAGFGVLALLPERGPLGPGPATVAGLLIILLAMWLRDLPAPALLDQALFNTGGTLVWNPVLLLSLVMAVVVTAFQLWRPTPMRAVFLAGLLILLPLSQGTPDRAQALTLGGAAILLIWVGLLAHAWRLAFIDELTGLPNRRALELRLRQRHSPLVMVDVDHFKRFNDRYGHDAGDQVLRRVADRLAAAGGGFRAYRYGGEEFTLLLPRRDIKRLQARLDSLRKSIAEHPFHLRGQSRDKRQRGQGGGRGIKITASFGLALPRPGETVQDAMKRADQALYRAKKKGRNRVEIDH
ncbi:GGDEF domain-containing protein [Natronospira bacteriovora]|uniref:diguanylate cyclase n=1 Tax=Natronospira bacteriovora TaxID=3069753 RepID=A0ABU0W6L1_9GAMM|nr:GGDEF domain-containing protein [Natronospira sp. AB-CW4]MDQ2069100.1 GGDEF domain-containing protein [Natronospira sp. AB-CW4]